MPDSYFIKWGDDCHQGPYLVYYDRNDSPGNQQRGRELMPVGGGWNPHYVAWAGSFTDEDAVFLIGTRGTPTYSREQPRNDSFQVYVATKPGERFTDEEGTEWLRCFVKRLAWSTFTRGDLKQNLWGR